MMYRLGPAGRAIVPDLLLEPPNSVVRQGRLGRIPGFQGVQIGQPLALGGIVDSAAGIFSSPIDFLPCPLHRPFLLTAGQPADTQSQQQHHQKFTHYCLRLRERTTGHHRWPRAPLRLYLRAQRHYSKGCAAVGPANGRCQSSRESRHEQLSPPPAKAYSGWRGADCRG